MNIQELEKREKIVKQKKYKILERATNVTKAKKELDYEYYLCDCCGIEIKTGKIKWEERNGGILKYPKTNLDHIELALCNKCLRKSIRELDKFYKGR